MSIDGVGFRTSYLGSSLLGIRKQLDDLQTQLASGKVSQTYSGQGPDRNLAIGLRAQLSLISGYKDAMTNVTTRINVADLALDRLSAVGEQTKAASLVTPVTLDNTGQTVGQRGAQSSLAEALQLLNTRAGDRYLFSGRATDTPATENADVILNGSGTRAGLKQVIAERRTADLGTAGLGRLAVTAPTTSSVAITQDASPFGLKLAGVTSALTGATVAGPTGAPPAVTVDFTAQPLNGEKIKFSVTLPDGSSESFELTASDATPTPSGGFAIGATPDDTAANLLNAVTASIGKIANTSLIAASAVAASDNFFDQPPQRVGSSPFGAATTLVAGTSTDTVSWYTGETGATPARGTAVARIDEQLAVQYGARADEAAIRNQIQSIALYAAVTTAPTDPNAVAQVMALNLRVTQNLAPQAGQQSIADIQTDFAGAMTSMNSAKERQTQSKAMIEGMLDQVEGISDEEVATKILSLQTRLQASYQTTSMLYQTTLLNFL